MLNLLAKLKPEIIKYLDSTDEWDSLIINRRTPHTIRVFRMFGENRVCLHQFNYFDKGGGDEAFMHPHPWPGAFNILAGSYRMKLGYTATREDSNIVPICETIMGSNSAYEITNPLTWHSVEPISATVFTVMINGPAWVPAVAHTQVRTTKGKDLEKLSPSALIGHLNLFKNIL